MAKKQKNLNQPENQLERQDVSKNVWKIEKVTKNKATEITRTFTRHAWPREVIEHAKYKKYPVESGVVKFFNRTKGEWFITPADQMKKDIYVRDFERAFKDWEKVNYIDINHEALITEPGKIRYFNPTKREWFVIPNAGWKDIYVQDFDRIFKDWEEVNFIANKKRIVVAIQKVEK